LTCSDFFILPIANIARTVVESDPDRLPLCRHIYTHLTCFTNFRTSCIVDADVCNHDVAAGDRVRSVVASSRSIDIVMQRGAVSLIGDEAPEGCGPGDQQTSRHGGMSSQRSECAMFHLKSPEVRQTRYFGASNAKNRLPPNRP